MRARPLDFRSGCLAAGRRAPLTSSLPRHRVRQRPPERSLSLRRTNPRRMRPPRMSSWSPASLWLFRPPRPPRLPRLPPGRRGGCGGCWAMGLRAPLTTRMSSSSRANLGWMLPRLPPGQRGGSGGCQAMGLRAPLMTRRPHMESTRQCPPARELRRRLQRRRLRTARRRPARHPAPTLGRSGAALRAWTGP